MREIFDTMDLNNIIGAKPLKFKVLQTKKSTKSKVPENIVEIDNDIINQYKLWFKNINLWKSSNERKSLTSSYNTINLPVGEL